MQARCLDNFILNFSILINDWLLILAHSGYAIILLQPAIVGCSGALQKGDFSPNFCKTPDPTPALNYYFVGVQDRLMFFI